jgi:predicted benzoate:H+ symporter BenE
LKNPIARKYFVKTSRKPDVDRRRYLDFMAGVAVCSLGHSHPKYIGALKEQLDKVTVGSFTTETRAGSWVSLAIHLRSIGESSILDSIWLLMPIVIAVHSKWNTPNVVFIVWSLFRK